MMKKLLKASVMNEKGAASVLVIFMLLVLVTLGALAITSANSNYKLSNMTLEWNRMYYELDGTGEELLAALDTGLQNAEYAAVEYVEAERYADSENGEISTETQTAIYEGYRSGLLSRSEIASKIYMYYADIFVKELSLDFPEVEAYTLDSEAFIDSILVEANVKSTRPGVELCGLNIAIWVEPVEYLAEDGGSVARANDSLRYTIEDWYEYQEPLNEEEAPAEELWDGTL